MDLQLVQGGVPQKFVWVWFWLCPFFSSVIPKYGIVLLWFCSSLRGGSPERLLVWICPVLGSVCPKILLRVCLSLRSGCPKICESCGVDLPLDQV